MNKIFGTKKEGLSTIIFATNINVRDKIFGQKFGILQVTNTFKVDFHFTFDERYYQSLKSSSFKVLKVVYNYFRSKVEIFKGKERVSE